MRSASLVVVALATACQLISSSLASARNDSGNSSSASGEFDGFLKSEQIFIRREDGATFGVVIEPHEKVNVLQRKVYEIAGIPRSRQRLSIGKGSLQEEYDLSDYRIKAGSIVNLTAWPRDGELLTNFNVISPARELFPISTRLSDSVASLKETLTQWTKIPSEQQRLIIRGKELEDARQLLDYDIWNGTSVHMSAPVDTRRGEVKILLKTIRGGTIPVDIDLSETVEKLKEKIQELTGAPTFVQLLVFNLMTLNDPDFLCDYGLEAGSRVHLTFMSQQVKDLSLVGRLQVVARAPVFREASEDQMRALDAPWKSLYLDQRNWMHCLRRYDPRMIFYHMTPIAYLDPNPDDEGSMEQARVLIKSARPDDQHWSIIALRAQYKIATILRSFRKMLTKTRGEMPGFELGAICDPAYPLGANINNFAPNELADEEIMYLFKLSDKIRRQLESDASTGEDTLGLPKQRTYNNMVFSVYVEAIAGLPQVTENYQPLENEECPICRDSLHVEPAFKPACGHGFHNDCAHDWLANLHKTCEVARCPYCRARFRYSFATYVGDE